MKNVALFAAGFVAGFAALFVLILIFGDYEEEPVVAQPAVQAAVANEPATVAAPQADNAPAAIAQVSGPTYTEVCKPNTANMTDPQITAHAGKYIGQRVSGWRGWVYDVVSKSDGTYDLEIAMQERGLFWSRDVVIENIVSDLAARLNVEQPVTLSGRIAKAEVFLDSVCNPLVVDEYVLVE